MTCDIVRNLLPLFIYDELAPTETAAVAAHLADCPHCQADHSGLIQTRAALDAGPVPVVAIDAARLIRSESDRQITRLRRWRGAALAAGALAAALLIVFALRIQVHAGDGQLVIAWGNHQSVKPVILAPNPEFDERLQLVQDLVRAVATDVNSRDAEQHAAFVRLHAEVNGIQQFTVQRWNEAERDLATLYRTAFHRPEPGEKP